MSNEKQVYIHDAPVDPKAFQDAARVAVYIMLERIEREKRKEKNEKNSYN